MSTTRSRLIDRSFPPEILLEVVQRLPFDKNLVPQLASIHPYIQAILVAYETSVTKAFVQKNLYHALTDFPTSRPTYVWLSRCVQQYDVVDDVMEVLTSEHNCFAVEKHNVSLVNTGLYLLYRLQEFEAPDSKIAFIKALPRDPLTAVFLAIHYSTLTARYESQGIINQQTYGRFLDANRLELRNDIEFAFSEGVLDLGAKFVADVLLRAEGAEPALLCIYHDHSIHDWVMQRADANADPDFQPPITQGPHRDPETKARSLYTTLLERLAELYGCPLQEVISKVEEEVELPDHDLAWLNLHGKARVIGETVF
ncbi:hypothetical protein BDV96DRAFT_272840 [Lophiotrema nucula]|uniref:Uncharacterized protein n=1 Tax=Lophiotrema nucula TaxID=690887 RepID=A0A6A5ZNF2_9PLEO|nr:hypothetical protein BDV96DRAFT_272840 [Lophiotrema nucula]